MLFLIISFTPNVVPIVDKEFSLNSFFKYLKIILVFPTPESPKSIILIGLLSVVLLLILLINKKYIYIKKIYN